MSAVQLLPFPFSPKERRVLDPSFVLAPSSCLTLTLVPSSHMVASTVPVAAFLEANPTLSEVRPKPGGGRGKLTVVDSRTGKSYELEINDDGAIKASDFKKVRPLNKAQ